MTKEELKDYLGKEGYLLSTNKDGYEEYSITIGHFEVIDGVKQEVRYTHTFTFLRYCVICTLITKTKDGEPEKKERKVPYGTFSKMETVSKFSDWLARKFDEDDSNDEDAILKQYLNTLKKNGSKFIK